MFWYPNGKYDISRRHVVIACLRFVMINDTFILFLIYLCSCFGNAFMKAYQIKVWILVGSSSKPFPTHLYLYHYRGSEARMIILFLLRLHGSKCMYDIAWMLMNYKFRRSLVYETFLVSWSINRNIISSGSSNLLDLKSVDH